MPKMPGTQECLKPGLKDKHIDASLVEVPYITHRNSQEFVTWKFL